MDPDACCTLLIVNSSFEMLMITKKENLMFIDNSKLTIGKCYVTDWLDCRIMMRLVAYNVFKCVTILVAHTYC